MSVSIKHSTPFIVKVKITYFPVCAYSIAWKVSNKKDFALKPRYASCILTDLSVSLKMQSHQFEKSPQPNDRLRAAVAVGDFRRGCLHYISHRLSCCFASLKCERRAYWLIPDIEKHQFAFR